MWRTLIVGALGLVVWSIPTSAEAKVPNINQVLERLDEWRANPPAGEMRYRAWQVAPEPSKDRPLVIDVQRRLSTAPPAFRDSASVAFWLSMLTAPDVATLRRAGVDILKTCLYYRDGRVVVIVGVREPTERDPQVWFDRDTGAPMVVHLYDETLTLGPVDRPGTWNWWPAHLTLLSGKRRYFAELAVQPK